MNQEKTYTIREISEGISNVLHQAWPEPFWVVGEIQGLDRAKHGKHWYFQLCESEGDGEVHRLSATLWNRNRDRLFGAKGKLRGLLDPEEPLDGIKIRAQCRIDFYAPYGKLSLHVDDIDPAYTLGDLEARRQALIEKLTKKGLLHKNRETELAQAPLKLGLITSDGSAAYNDFMQELEKSGFGFQVFLCDARMQGEEAPATIKAAFNALERLEPDAIVLIRGGGSRLDLSWFDQEEIVNRIINASCPVVTGIGHEIDITVCEMTAHSGLKTPTAAAVFLVERIRDTVEAIIEAGRGIARTVSERLTVETLRLRELAFGITSRVQLCMAEAVGFFQDAPRRLVAGAERMIEREGADLAMIPGRMAAGRYLRRFENLRFELSRVCLRLAHEWRRLHERETGGLNLLAERCRLLDPVQTIQRGYALLRSPEGGPIKSVEKLAPNDPFTAILRDGTVDASVIRINKEDDHGRKKNRQLKIW